MKTKATPPSKPKGDRAISVIEPAMVVCLAMLVIMSLLYAPDGCQKRASDLLPHAPRQYVPPPQWRYEECPKPARPLPPREKMA